MCVLFHFILFFFRQKGKPDFRHLELDTLAAGTELSSEDNVTLKIPRYSLCVFLRKGVYSHLLILKGLLYVGYPSMTWLSSFAIACRRNFNSSFDRLRLVSSKSSSDINLLTIIVVLDCFVLQEICQNEIMALFWSSVSFIRVSLFTLFELSIGLYWGLYL